ncbi:MAG: 2-hydroxyacid dehydrogenase [Pirellulaceae bacterium]|nr:2-hydroxyacid dehydrogenase [Pirellulaceae bacterium]
MKIAVFSTESYDREFLTAANVDAGHDLTFYEPRLTAHTCALAAGFPAICAFVNDQLDAQVLPVLAREGVRLVAMRCTGFNNVDLRAAEQLNMIVTRVAAYSPYSVAEHAVALILALDRRLYKAYNRIREGNFSLEGLMGFDLHGRKAGIVGTGKIGAVVARILHGFGCNLLAYDVTENPEVEACEVRYVSKSELLAESDIITLHCPLTPDTCHLIDAEALGRMKRGAMLINTSRGALIDTKAVIRALKSGRLGFLGLDVYEEEADLFYRDLSSRVIQDDVFSRMLTFPNVIITGHQAFFTRNALDAIAQETLHNITLFERGERPSGLITAEKVLA